LSHTALSPTALSPTVLSPTVLLTSFAPWTARQDRNASDDLLLALRTSPLVIRQQTGINMRFLHRLPVYVETAYDRILQAQQDAQADLILCCGMAESRQVLSLEAQAKLGNSRLTTPLDLEQLQSGLHHTEISHDAGQFVCNGLFYGLLAHFSPLAPQVGFLHVPPLTNSNLPDLLVDLLEILRRLGVLFPG
jgi:pyroglutamyl-peptidase